MTKRLGRMMRALAVSAVVLGISGCSAFTGTDETKESSAPATEVTQTESVSETETPSETEPVTTEPESTTEAAEGPEIIHRILLATDLHYLADELSDGKEALLKHTETCEGQMVPYVQEILDAFIEDVIAEDPDVLILSGDLTLDGEKLSHEELAEKLRTIEDEGIPVLVIPGNHDINNPQAKGFAGADTYKVDWTTPEDFREIYGEFGYDEAFDEEADTLSYFYELESDMWIMMLDSCQYETVCKVGGMIQDTTYDWFEPYLLQAQEEDIQILPVSHHNLLEQTSVSDLFVDDCTLEHDERFIRMLEENAVPLYLSGHLHVQHFAETDGGIHEVVTSSLSVPPIQYGVVELYDDGSINYHTKAVDMEGWAERHNKRDKNLLHFNEYSAKFFESLSYDEAYRSLRGTEATPKQKNDMAKLFAQLNPAYYSGRSYTLKAPLAQDPAFALWDEFGFFSEFYDTMVNILEDEVEDYNELRID